MRVPNIDHIKAQQPLLGEALQAIMDGIDSIGQKSGFNPQGTVTAPAPPSAINVTANHSGIHRVSIVDNNPRTRQVHYFVEHDTDPNFSNPQPEHLGVARQRSLPQSMGTTPVYYRAFASYPDGPRSQMIYLGNSQAPTGVVDNAPVAGPNFHLTTGSGTSQRGGEGFGREQFVSSSDAPGKAPKIY